MGTIDGRHYLRATATAALSLLVLLASGCADRPPDAAPTGDSHVADSTRDPSLQTTACRDPANTLIAGGRVGGLEIGAAADAVRRDCTIAGDTTLQIEGQSQPALRVEIGGDTVLAEIGGGTIRRITVVSPGPATADSVRVGTPVRDLARHDSAVVAHGEGQLFVIVRSLCGLSFGVGGLPGPFGWRWTMDELSTAPDSTRVTRILVTGGCDR